MSRKSGYRFSEKDMRSQKHMSRKSGYRFSEKDMRLQKRMSRKSGYPLSEKDMPSHQPGSPPASPAEGAQMTAWDSMAARREGVPVLMPGHVWLAGAGPGDPGLLTLDALAGLQQADVIVHDALVDRRVLALAVETARLEFAGKRGGKPSANQADISERLIALARDGRRVLRLKGGDPFVFGRGGEEALALAAANVPFRIIPGVTSGLAALAAASIPATLRGINRAVIFAAGHGTREGADEAFDWAPLARTGAPFVLYMVMHHLERITAALMAAGLAPRTPAAIVASAATPQERILVSTLEAVAADAREQKYEPPAIVVIGEIVNVRAQLLAAAAYVPPPP
jgi:uroporphyrin-III C-methyltransferase